MSNSLKSFRILNYNYCVMHLTKQRNLYYLKDVMIDKICTMCTDKHLKFPLKVKRLTSIYAAHYYIFNSYFIVVIL